LSTRDLALPRLAVSSLAIGCFVCLFGYSVESVGAPPWAVVAAPVPLDILLLWYVLRKPRKMAVAYVLAEVRLGGAA
jgi:hypothetical protein